MENVFVNLKEVGRELINYVGSDDFKRATKDLSLEATNAFMSGIGMAGIVIVTKCQQYMEGE